MIAEPFGSRGCSAGDGYPSRLARFQPHPPVSTPAKVHRVPSTLRINKK